jgi:hypothetical protein
MFTRITFYISEEDRLNIERVKERHPALSSVVIFRRALGMYANNLEKPVPLPSNTPRSARQATEESFGPQV